MCRWCCQKGSKVRENKTNWMRKTQPTYPLLEPSTILLSSSADNVCSAVVIPFIIIITEQTSLLRKTTRCSGKSWQVNTGRWPFNMRFQKKLLTPILLILISLPFYLSPSLFLPRCQCFPSLFPFKWLWLTDGLYPCNITQRTFLFPPGAFIHWPN